jgi:hypothetical protein
MILNTNFYFSTGLTKLQDFLFQTYPVNPVEKIFQICLLKVSILILLEISVFEHGIRRKIHLFIFRVQNNKNKNQILK